MTIVITAIIITLAVIGILSETRTTDNATKANTTDSNLHGFTIPSFDKWCTEHPENEATERPSLFRNQPTLRRGSQPSAGLFGL